MPIRWPTPYYGGYTPPKLYAPRTTRNPSMAGMGGLFSQPDVSQPGGEDLSLPDTTYGNPTEDTASGVTPTSNYLTPSTSYEGLMSPMDKFALVAGSIAHALDPLGVGGRLGVGAANLAAYNTQIRAQEAPMRQQQALQQRVMSGVPLSDAELTSMAVTGNKFAVEELKKRRIRAGLSGLMGLFDSRPGVSAESLTPETGTVGPSEGIGGLADKYSVAPQGPKQVGMEDILSAYGIDPSLATAVSTFAGREATAQNRDRVNTLAEQVAAYRDENAKARNQTNIDRNQEMEARLNRIFDETKGVRDSLINSRDKRSNKPILDKYGNYYNPDTETWQPIPGVTEEQKKKGGSGGAGKPTTHDKLREDYITQFESLADKGATGGIGGYFQNKPQTRQEQAIGIINQLATGKDNTATNAARSAYTEVFLRRKGQAATSAPSNATDFMKKYGGNNATR